MAISPIDAIVIAVYLVGITAFGIKVGYRRNASSQQYFLANKSLGWFTVGAAVFTSNISTIHLVGYAAGGARDGLVIGNFEWMACFILILLALMFAPFYINSGVATLPEFMERRYCPAARTFLAVIGILGALLIHIGISLFAAAKVFESLLGVPMFATIVVLSLFTVTYAALGGLKAVVMTESIQVVLLLGGATLITILGVRALPRVGVHDLATFQHAVAPGQLHMLQPVINAQGHLNEFSWLAVAAWLSHSRHLVLVCGPDPRAARAGRAHLEGWAERRAVCRLSEALAGLSHGVSRRHRLCALAERRDPSGQRARHGPSGLQHHAAAIDPIPHPGRRARIDRRQPGRRADELHGGGAQ